MNTLYDSLIKAYGAVSIKDGDLLSYLGCQVEMLEDGRIKISQPGYAKQLCKTFIKDSTSKATIRTLMAVTPKKREDDDD